MKFNKKYFFLTIILLIAEILIVLYVNDRIIRPYVGDFLVVILLYCAIRAVFAIRSSHAALGVLLFAYFVELLQYWGLVYKLGLGQSRLALIVLGSSFEWIDLVAYTLGVLLIIWLEYKCDNTR